MDKHSKWFLIIFIILSIADVLLTYYMSFSGRFQEVNPIAHYLMDKFGAWILFILKFVGVLAISFLVVKVLICCPKNFRWLQNAAFIFFNIITFLVVLNNVWILLNLR